MKERSECNKSLLPSQFTLSASEPSDKKFTFYTWLVPLRGKRGERGKPPRMHVIFAVRCLSAQENLNICMVFIRGGNVFCKYYDGLETAFIRL